MLVAEWVRLATGVDTAWDMRGLYGSRSEAGLLLGGEALVAVVGRCAARAGLVPTSDPKPGDIAVVERAGEPVCAIRVARGYAVMAERRGLIASPHFALVAGWSLDG